MKTPIDVIKNIMIFFMNFVKQLSEKLFIIIEQTIYLKVIYEI